MLNKKQPDQVETVSNRFIEEFFPIQEVSVESAKEKSIMKAYISTLHVWWARKPLASSRATAYAALISNSENKSGRHNQKTSEFIVQLCKWENSLNRDIMETARRDILDAHGGVPPKVLDPFAGGGSIPLETLRLGCETYSNEYNPVATLIQKCTFEYPQRYHERNNSTVRKDYGNFSLADSKTGNRLLNDVNKWGKILLQEAKIELAKFYPGDKDGSIPVAYIWARTVLCQNPNCNTEIPLISHYWLAKKTSKDVLLYPSVSGNRVKFHIVDSNSDKPEMLLKEDC